MSVISVNTSNGSGITATPSTGAVNINSLVAGLNGIVISGGYITTNGTFIYNFNYN